MASSGQAAIALNPGTGNGLFRCLAPAATRPVYEIATRLRPRSSASAMRSFELRASPDCSNSCLEALEAPFSRRAKHRLNCILMVELRGLEPLTPSMPWRCATSCATAPPPTHGQLRNPRPPAQRIRNRAILMPNARVAIFVDSSQDARAGHPQGWKATRPPPVARPPAWWTARIGHSLDGGSGTAGQLARMTSVPESGAPRTNDPAQPSSGRRCGAS